MFNVQCLKFKVSMAKAVSEFIVSSLMFKVQSCSGRGAPLRQAQ